MFKESFIKSLENADLRQSEKIQINQVFQELSSEIFEASDGKINLFIKADTEKTKYIAGCKKRYLVASNNYKKKSLCEYEDNYGRFPVKLKYTGTDASFYDKESLITGIQELLESIESGLIFKSLMVEE